MEPQLTLKIGAQVMFNRNDSNGDFVNGTLGKVTGFEDDAIIVTSQDGKAITVGHIEWSNTDFELDKEKGKIMEKVKGSFEQYPLILAWAVTIHKSQGLTFDKVIIDIGNRGAFAGGQVYVALSRCRTLEGIYLKSKIQPRDIFFNERIVDYSSLSSTEENIRALIAENPPIVRQKYSKSAPKTEISTKVEPIPVTKEKKKSKEEKKVEQTESQEAL
jgi:ATP-dependent exoDNAse (exonuclease V) alpha subunit